MGIGDKASVHRRTPFLGAVAYISSSSFYDVDDLSSRFCKSVVFLGENTVVYISVQIENAKMAINGFCFFLLDLFG